MIDSDQRDIENGIRWLGNKLRMGGTGLFYFAGHGIQVNGKNYLIPIGGNIQNEFDVKYEAVDAGRVLSQMDAAGNKVNIIILDACRNNPFARSFRSSTRGLAVMDAPTGSILAYSTGPGSVASDGSGRNSLYTSSLLKYIQTPNLEIERLFKKVRSEVLIQSERKQVPWEVSSLTGEFYFSSTRMNQNKTVQSNPANKTNAVDAGELEFWKSIKDSKNPDYFKSYLASYPNGIFVSIAQIKINEMEIKALRSEPVINKIDDNTTSAISDFDDLKSKKDHPSKVASDSDITIIITSDVKGAVTVDTRYAGVFKKNWLESTTKQIIVNDLVSGEHGITIINGEKVWNWSGFIEHASFVHFENGDFRVVPILGPEGYWKLANSFPLLKRIEYIHFKIIDDDRFEWTTTGTKKASTPYIKTYLTINSNNRDTFLFHNNTYCLRGHPLHGSSPSHCTRVVISHNKMKMTIFTEKKMYMAQRINQKKYP